MWESDPLCYWCGIATIWYSESKGRPPVNSATIDHLDGRLSLYRGQGGNQELRHVLACWRCNNERSHAQRAANVDLQRISSGKFPIGAAVIKLADAVEAALADGTAVVILQETK